jgi:hypothetical protein
VQNLNLPGSDYFQKLMLLKREKGGLSAEDEKKFRVSGERGFREGGEWRRGWDGRVSGAGDSGRVRG